MSVGVSAARAPMVARSHSGLGVYRRLPRVTGTVVAFAPLAGWAAWHFSRLLLHVPWAPVAAAVAVAVAVLAATAAVQTGSARRRRAAQGSMFVVGTLVALWAVGLPAGLLLPWHWGALTRHLLHGASGLAGGLWPYRGSERWTQLSVLAVLAMVLVSAAALAGRAPARTGVLARGIALALLVALYAAGAVNNAAGHPQLDGLGLLIALAAWVWVPRVSMRDLPRAGVWLAVGTGAALLAWPALAHRPPLVDDRPFNPFGAPGTAFDWDQTYGPITWSRSSQVLLDISAREPELWKATTLDRFDGVRFVRSAAPAPGAPALELGASRAGSYERVTVSDRGLRSNLLIGAGRLLTVSGSHPTVQDPDGTGHVLGGSLLAGDSYSATVYVPHLSSARLRAAPPGFPAVYERYAQLEIPSAAPTTRAPSSGAGAVSGRGPLPRVVGPPGPGLSPGADLSADRALRASPYAGAYALARRLGAGAWAPYEVARRIERFLRRHYTYTEQPPLRPYPLEAFLVSDRSGYCQQFSGAMTLLLRMNGIAARVAAGFSPGVADPLTHHYRVRALDAHAWVEVYFGGIGWVPFDPTPPSSQTRLAAAMGPDRFVAPVGRLQSSRARVPAAAPLALSSATATGAHPRYATVPLALAAAVLTVLVAGALAGRAAARRLRRTLALGGEDTVAELAGALRRLGYGPAEAMTLTDLERRMRLTRGEQAARYVRLLAQRRFAAAPAGGPTPHDRRDLRRALSRGAGPRARLRCLLALPPGMLRRPPR